MQAAVNNAMAAYQQAQVHAGGGAGHAMAGGGNVNLTQHAPPQRGLPPFPGLDARGISWHTSSPTLGCRSNPCNAPFCQGCALHGHTVDECRKRLFNNPAVNKSGYWCEQKPGCPPIKYIRPTVNAAIQAQAQPQQPPAFPIPYQLHGAPAQQPANNNGAAAVNHTANPSAPRQGADGNAQ